MNTGGKLRIGWAQEDISPSEPVYISGQFYCRISEGIQDPITVTACAIQSDEDHVVFLSCDLVAITDELRDSVRTLLQGRAEGLDPMKVIMHVTHSHAAPEIKATSINARSGDILNEDLGVQPVEQYLSFLSEVMARCIAEAWRSRTSGKAAYGLGYAVVGRNRRWVNESGESRMYGLEPGEDAFRHIEGFEDHSVQVLAAYDANNRLTGLMVNLACPSQVSEHNYLISADYWHETRQLLRQKFGENLFILPQCSVAGDQSPHLLYEQEANKRMLQLKNRTVRQEIAHRIATAVEDLLPCLSEQAEADVVLRHHVGTVDMPLNRLGESDVEQAREEANYWTNLYEQRKQKLDADPALQNEPHWYVPITEAYGRMLWNQGVINRFEKQSSHNVRSAEVHVLKLGNIAIATSPFEYYLDFGIQIKLRSPATQTFLIQLAGEGTYIPSPRSVQGGGYGSVPASNPIGAAGGQLLADYTVRMIRSLWEE